MFPFSLFKKKQEENIKPASKITDGRIVPRIKHTNFLSTFDNNSGINEKSKPIIEALAGDLILTYAVDNGSCFVSLNNEILDQLEIDQDDLLSIAKFNALSGITNLRRRTDGTVTELTADENMVACTILYPEMWEEFEKQLGGPIVASFPHRDMVYFGSLNSHSTASALKNLIGQVNFNDTHALSKLLYFFEGNRWHVLDS